MIATRTLSIVRAEAPAVRTQLDPQWNKARQLLADGRRTAEEFASEIERLRTLFMQPPGLRRGSESQSVIQKNEGGFQAQLQAQLGMHPEQAKRILDRARYTGMLRAIAAGQTVRYFTGSGSERKEQTFVSDAEARARARQLLDDALAGDVKPSAAWAGLIGEGRRVAKTGKKERSATDHAMNISNAIAKLKTSLPHWRSLDPHDRAVIETEFNAMKHLLEGTLL